MPVWSTRRDRGDPATLTHAIVPDGHGRTLGPVCGTSTDGLWLAAWTDWEKVPLEARCAACGAVLLPSAGP